MADLLDFSGSGIPIEIQEKIMQPFFSNREIGRGTGLGLSISRGIVESHGGKIELNAKSANTQFIISQNPESERIILISFFRFLFPKGKHND